MKPSTARSYRWILWTLVVVGFAADQATKYIVFGALYPEAASVSSLTARREIVPGSFSLTAHFTPELDTSTGLLHVLRTASSDHLPFVNRGALFGVGGEDTTGNHHNSFFLYVSVAAALLITGWTLRRGVAQDRALCAALGLILAGTLGNLYDRIVFMGVRDFLDFYLIHWPVFNVADCCLVCGAALLFLQAVLSPAPATHVTATAPAQETTETPGASACVLSSLDAPACQN
jgi:lipoprotein signal peptidase